MLTLQSYDFDIEHIKGKDNEVADGFSRLCPDERSDFNSRKGRNFSKGGEETADVGPENLISSMELLDFAESTSVPKLFISLITEHFEDQLELWALPVIEYETISDKDIQQYLDSELNGPAGHFL
jgi:hypothetical protein